METVDVELWTPHVNQQKIIDCNKRFAVIVCGRRFGKTYLAVNKLVEDALDTRGGLFFYIAPTYRQGKMIAWELLKSQARVLPDVLVAKINESELSVEFVNGAKVNIKGADNPDSLRGVGLHGCILDEYADMKSNVFSHIIRPTLLTTQGWCWFIGTPKGFNHLYDVYTEAQTDERWATFHFTSYDNPLIPDEEIDEVKKKGNPDVFQQEYMAEFRKMTGLVYKEFDRQTNAEWYNKTKPDHFASVFVGVDFGFTNPSAVLAIGQDRDKRFYVLDEWYETGKLTADIILQGKRFMSDYGVNYFYPDSAEPDRIKEMENEGLYVREVNKSIVPGIDRIRSLIKEKRLFINPACANTISEIEMYRYPEDRDGKSNNEVPIDDYNHALDALRYAIFSHDPVDVSLDKEELSLFNEDYT
jgi:PBSX family phage terminase large subunit